MARAQNSGTRITVVFMLIAASVVTYFIAPIFLPVWAWFNLNFQDLATRHGVPLEQIQQEYTMVVRYEPRASGDPIPWQVVYMNPEYTIGETDEYYVAVRVHLISTFTGEPPGTLTMGTTARDHYFRIQGYRFPPGFFNLGDDKRPVVVYHGGSKKQLSIPEARDWESKIRRDYDNDDYWPERDEGWEPGKDKKQEADEDASDASEAPAEGSGEKPAEGWILPD